MSEKTQAPAHTPAAKPAPPVAATSGLVLQRCACGETPGVDGECADCRAKRLQRSAAGSTASAAVPPIVGEVLASSGHPLDAATQAEMGARFGHDFSQVRVHTDAQAAESAAAVSALAYTVGRDVVFGAGQYAPGTHAGQRLLAHELTHVVQQSTTGASAGGAAPLTLDNPHGEAEREAQKAGDQALAVDSGSAAHRGRRNPLAAIHPHTQGAFRMQRQQASTNVASPVAIPARGPNPATQLRPLCRNLSQGPIPTTHAQVRAHITGWRDQAIHVLQQSAAASNASHWQAILKNIVAELNHDADELLPQINSLSPSGMMDILRGSCQDRLREVEIAFRYNIVLEEAQAGWRTAGSDWDDVEAAFAGLPIEATWANPREIHFRREVCDPSEFDPVTGACGGHVGGRTEPSPGGALVHIYNAGVGQSPYPRSVSLGIPATVQTIRHEMGHVVDADISQAARTRLFHDIMDWKDYSWSWVTGGPRPTCPPTPYPDLRQERCDLCTDLGFTARPASASASSGLICDDARLDQWLATFQQPGSTRQIGDRTYTRGDHFLNSVPTVRLPQGPEFEYARQKTSDFIAEVYALAISRPEFVSDALRPEQAAWFREEVFHTPATLAELAASAAVAEPIATQFVIQGSRLFTREQLETLLNRLLAAYPHTDARTA